VNKSLDKDRSGLTMIFTDQAEEEIAKKLDPIFFAKVFGRITTHLDYQLARAVFNEYVTKSSELPPEEAFIMLNRARLWLETYLSHLASGYSPLRWLWMMRRIPHHVFSGELATTFGYDQALAETLTARSEKPESRLEIKRNGIISYSIFGATVRRLAEFCAVARYLSSLHASLRWAGKGSKFSVKRNARPVVISEPALEAAVRLYDQRGSSGTPFQRSGTILGTPTNLQQGASILYLHRMEPKLLPLPVEYIPETVPGTRSGDEISVLCRFFPRAVSLEPFTRLLKMTDQVTIWPREAMILILLLWGAWRMIFRHRAGFLSVLTRGYLLLDEELIEYLYHPILAEYDSHFGELFHGGKPPESAENFLTELGKIGGCTWPLRPAPVVRREKQVTCVDLLAAGECLNAVLEAPISDGVIPNIRGQHFELLTQELIDRSSWKPASEIGNVRGRTLRIGGAPVTDIDAIGERNNELLAVSCKSVIYSGEYDSGDFRTVRNAASAIINAVKEWQDKMSLLRSAGRGDNFDFSKFSTIIPLVCTPAIVYVPIGLATAEVRPGLRAASSVAELAAWLGIEQ
jgi:hypothetical protein